MLEKGIAYRKTQVNWDPVDQTVLANEQVIDGKGLAHRRRGGKARDPGYYLKITDYAEELLDQRADGHQAARLARARQADAGKLDRQERRRALCLHRTTSATPTARIVTGSMYVFTTRADTIMGVTFCAVAPSTRWPRTPPPGNPPGRLHRGDCKKGGTTEADWRLEKKVGMPTGLTVTHPLTGERSRCGSATTC